MTITFNHPVVILATDGAVLLLDTGDGPTSPAEAPVVSGNGSESLTFMYTVAEGDESRDLGTYDDGEAGHGGGLIGSFLRDSDAASQVCLQCSNTINTRKRLASKLCNLRGK